jgi:transmembrane sensor
MTERDHAMPANSGGEIGARAADFLQRRRFLRWTGADQAELDAWLEESTLHRVTFLRLEARAARIERLADLRPPSLNRTVSMSRFRFAIPLFATLASLSLIAILGFAAEQYFLQPSDRVYSTEVGGRAVLRFADRTQIDLNTDTIVRFRMTGEERTVWLEKGEAYFRVSHDAKNPFTVIVGNHRITDLGTEFLVRRNADELAVALMKGRAQLVTEGARPQVAMLSPGDEAVATPASLSFARKTPQELADELAWQRGVLVFHHTKLADAVIELNRYNRTKLVIDDPTVARMPIGGEFRIDNLDEFLRTMQVVLKLQVGRAGNDILLFRSVGQENKTGSKRTPASTGSL